MKTKFTIFKNQLLGTTKSANSFDDLLSKMTKKEKEFWSNLKFKDTDNRTINIEREFIEQGMTFEECVKDYLDNATLEQLEEDILTI